MAPNRSTVRSLNRLIAGIYDTVDRYDAVVEHAHSFGSYAEYQHDVMLRRGIIRKLQRIVVHLDGVPRRSGTFRGCLKRCVVQILGNMIDDEGWTWRLFEREELLVMNRLAALIRNTDLSPSLRHELSSILAVLDEETSRLRSLNGSGPARKS